MARLLRCFPGGEARKVSLAILCLQLGAGLGRHRSVSSLALRDQAVHALTVDDVPRGASAPTCVLRFFVGLLPGVAGLLASEVATAAWHWGWPDCSGLGSIRIPGLTFLLRNCQAGSGHSFRSAAKKEPRRIGRPVGFLFGNRPLYSGIGFFFLAAAASAAGAASGISFWQLG